MPTLSVTPPSLSPSAHSLVDLIGEWMVLEVTSRHEKTVAAALGEAGIGYYLPMVREKRILAGKKRWLDLPLFPGYVFACLLSPSQEFDAMNHRSVYGRIRVKGQSRFCSELESVRRAIGSGAPVNRYPDLVVGEPARVRFGPLEGTEGTLIRRDDAADAFVIQVMLLGQAISVEIDPAMLEAA